MLDILNTLVLGKLRDEHLRVIGVIGLVCVDGRDCDQAASQGKHQASAKQMCQPAIQHNSSRVFSQFEARCPICENGTRIETPLFHEYGCDKGLMPLS